MQGMDEPGACRPLFESSLVRVGVSDCHPDDACFRAPGPVRHHSFLFPWRSVWVERPGAAPLLADPGLVTMYNLGDEVQRRELSPEGDRYVCFQLRTPELIDALVPYDPAAQDRPDRPFPWVSAPCGPSEYLLHKTLVDELGSDQPPDELEVEETAFALLRAVLRSVTSEDRREPPRAMQREVVDRARRCMALRPGRWSLEELADRAGCSAPYLSRSFPVVTGHRLTAYRNHLRLCEGLRRLEDPTQDLTVLALDLGFSSHSHMTATFTQHFGVSPRRLRARPPRRLRSLREQLRDRLASS